MKTTTTPTIQKPVLTHAALGSISHGTLRTEDLLTTFTSELEFQLGWSKKFFALPENAELREKLSLIVTEANSCTDDEGNILPDMEDAAENLINEDFPNAFTEHFAPPYCYFGTHEGDGSDFGYWPDWSSIEDLPAIADNSDDAIRAEQSDDFSTDVRYVNDHGNTTIFGADGSVLLELV